MNNEQHQPPESVEQPRKAIVLIVEDELGVKELLVETLNRDAEVGGPFERADEAIEWLKQNTPNWVITDWGLVDGKDAGKRVVNETNEKYPDCPITILTGDAKKVTFTPDELEVKKTEVVEKPFSPLSFIRRAREIKQAINRPKPPQGG